MRPSALSGVHGRLSLFQMGASSDLFWTRPGMTNRRQASPRLHQRHQALYKRLSIPTGNAAGDAIAAWSAASTKCCTAKVQREPMGSSAGDGHAPREISDAEGARASQQVLPAGRRRCVCCSRRLNPPSRFEGFPDELLMTVFARVPLLGHGIVP